MNLTDWIGSIGVSILLLAFSLNLMKRISQDSLAYIFLNFVGAAIACCASVLLNYWPFIILEGIWMVVSVISLITVLRKEQ